jgi:hypothetical protein
MLGNHFYHERIRKSVAMFGSLFNNIYVVRTDSSNKVISQARVPLSYAPATSFLDRIRENPDLEQDTKVAIKLPRMSFEIISYQYDSQRQLQKTNNINRTSGDSTTRNKFYASTPYIIGFQLNVYTKTQDDALQIIEQILPYFGPQYTLTIKPFADFSDIKEDVPITLNGISYTDAYEGALDSRRIIQYTLDFQMNANFYGAVQEASIIRKPIVDIYSGRTEIDSDGAFDLYSPSVRIEVNPNPLNASPDSDYGFTTTIYSYEDSA